MGWGATAKMKRIICASATELSQEFYPAEVAVFDMNAIGRQFFNYPAAVTPREAVIRFWKSQVAAQESVRLFGFHFDSAHKIPPERQKFLKETRYKPVERDVFPEEVKIKGRIYRRGNEPATDAEVKLLSRDFMPVSYGRVWSSSKGKQKLWGIISDLLVHLSRTLTAVNTTYIIEPPSGGRIQIPGQSSAGNNWGEADQKAVALVNEVQNNFSRIVVHTIDWDMVIAGAMIFNEGVQVKIARIYQDKESSALFYSAIAAKGKETIRLHEYVTPRSLGEPSTAFWLLAIGGVDYCKGLVRFGFSANDLHDEMAADDGSALLYSDTAIGVNIPWLFKQLSAFTIQRRKVSCPYQFEEEIKGIVFCMLYFLGCGAERSRAGPDMTEFSLNLSGCATLDDVLRRPQVPFYHPR